MLNKEHNQSPNSSEALGHYIGPTGLANLLEEPVTGVIHDMGNLIQIASSALNIISRSPSLATASALEPAITSAKASLDRAGALVRQTLGRVRDRNTAFERVSISDCLREFETLVRSTWDHNIRLDVRISEGLPFVRCSRLDLQNAILNLVYNARDALPDGGHISIVAANGSQGSVGQGIEVRVSDDGFGMTPETVARAFDPFFTTKCTGLGGIGLPMVRRFAQEANGSIEIESELGLGTTVTLRLPASEPSRLVPAAQPRS